MTKSAAKTSAGPTFVVAIEQSFPEDQRIVVDDLAFQIMPLTYRIFARIMGMGIIRNWMINWYEKTVPGTWGGMLCRKRYINEKLNQSASNIEGVVNLGAGFDTRVYTLDSICKLPVWELDQEEVIKSKEKRLKQIFDTLPKNVKNVQIDFDQEDIGQALRSKGYSNDMKIFFIWEAVTQYLKEVVVK